MLYVKFITVKFLTMTVIWVQYWHLLILHLAGALEIAKLPQNNDNLGIHEHTVMVFHKQSHNMLFAKWNYSLHMYTIKHTHFEGFFNHLRLVSSNTLDFIYYLGLFKTVKAISHSQVYSSLSIYRWAIWQVKCDNLWPFGKKKKLCQFKFQLQLLAVQWGIPTSPFALLSFLPQWYISTLHGLVRRLLRKINVTRILGSFSLYEYMTWAFLSNSIQLSPILKVIWTQCSAYWAAYNAWLSSHTPQATTRLSHCPTNICSQFIENVT
jgi:hypothetical protein